MPAHSHGQQGQHEQQEDHGHHGLDGPDLIVLSHLRWPFVWQRPHHLITRITALRAGSGGRTWFVEEPCPTRAVQVPRIVTEQHGDITRVWLEVPTREDVPKGRADFTAPCAQDYTDLLLDLLRGDVGDASDVADVTRPQPGASRPRPHVWLYTPMALDIAEALDPDLLVYDVMDDLSAFAQAPPELRLRQHRALRLADVVLAGGRSLHIGVSRHRPDVHLFPSGVDSRHYARSRTLRSHTENDGEAPRRRPVAGFVGVLDERLDADLTAEVARLLPEWDLRLVGPVADFKMDPATLPQAPNLHYAGPCTYDQLPAAMAGFDVAIMPFALNEATRSISPTKTLEYLAAGLPVVSTPIPDVVADFSDLVAVAAMAEDFAAACRRALDDPLERRDRRLRALEHQYQWDNIAARIYQLIQKEDTRSAVGASAR
jgi:hypothetical protein